MTWEDKKAVARCTLKEKRSLKVKNKSFVERSNVELQTSNFERYNYNGNFDSTGGTVRTVPLVVFWTAFVCLTIEKLLNIVSPIPMKYAKITYSAILVGGALWCAAIVLAPVFSSSPGIFGVSGKILYAFFKPICHQIGERSFHVDGMPFGVCSRCASIYFGFLLGVLIYPVVRDVKKPGMPSRLFLVFACIPIFIDGFPWRLGIYESTIASRAVTGGILGFTLVFFIVPAAIQAVSELAGIRSLTVCQRKGISNATETR